MEMNMRDWMIVIGVLLFLLVVLDGYRRALRERKNQVRMNRKAEKQRFADDEPSLTELPNGGNKRLVSGGASSQIIESDDDHNDPLFHNPFEREALQSRTLEASATEQLEKVQEEAELPDSNDDVHEDVLVSDDAIHFESVEALLDEEWLDDLVDETNGALTHSNELEETPSEALEKEPIRADFDELIMMHVLAQSKTGFKQAEIMQILQQCDLRLNAGSIYERFEQANGQGAVQFRIANATKSGQFMMNEDDDSLSGITLFMQLPEPEQAIEAFEVMVAVAQCVADNLHGTVKDELYSTMTEQTLQHCRQRIKDYLQQQLVKHG